MNVQVSSSDLYQTNTVVLAGDPAIVFDLGILPREVAAVLQAVGEGSVAFVCTHADWDHIYCLGARAGTPVYMSQGAVKRLPRQIETAHHFDVDTYIERPYDMRTQGSAVTVLGTGSQQIGGRALQVYAAPGHTPDGIVTFDSKTGTLVLGDYLSDLEFPFLGGSPNTYRRTLQMLRDVIRALQPRLVVPGHGSACDTPQALRRCDASERYLDALELHARKQAVFEPPAHLARAHRRNLQLARRALRRGQRPRNQDPSNL